MRGRAKQNLMRGRAKQNLMRGRANTIRTHGHPKISIRVGAHTKHMRGHTFLFMRGRAQPNLMRGRAKKCVPCSAL